MQAQHVHIPTPPPDTHTHIHIGLTFSHLARKGNKIHDNPTKEQENKNTKVSSKHGTLAAPLPSSCFLRKIALLAPPSGQSAHPLLAL